MCGTATPAEGHTCCGRCLENKRVRRASGAGGDSDHTYNHSSKGILRRLREQARRVIDRYREVTA